MRSGGREGRSIQWISRAQYYFLAKYSVHHNLINFHYLCCYPRTVYGTSFSVHDSDAWSEKHLRGMTYVYGVRPMIGPFVEHPFSNRPVCQFARPLDLPPIMSRVSQMTASNWLLNWAIGYATPYSTFNPTISFSIQMGKWLLTWLFSWLMSVPGRPGCRQKCSLSGEASVSCLWFLLTILCTRQGA